MGKVLIVIGVVLVLVGIIMTYSDRIPFLGKLPGDITIERDNFRLYFPLATSIILSIVISIILYLINRWKQ
jgi:thiosulfate reductase cytochrome b subunit